MEIKEILFNKFFKLVLSFVLRIRIKMKILANTRVEQGMSSHHHESIKYHVILYTFTKNYYSICLIVYVLNMEIK